MFYVWLQYFSYILLISISKGYFFSGTIFLSVLPECQNFDPHPPVHHHGLSKGQGFVKQKQKIKGLFFSVCLDWPGSPDSGSHAYTTGDWMSELPNSHGYVWKWTSWAPPQLPHLAFGPVGRSCEPASGPDGDKFSGTQTNIQGLVLTNKETNTRSKAKTMTMTTLARGDEFSFVHTNTYSLLAIDRDKGGRFPMRS